MENVKTKVIGAFKAGMLFDFLANNAWEMSKDELGAIAKELAYTLQNVMECELTTNQQKPYREELIEGLKDNLYD